MQLVPSHWLLAVAWIRLKAMVFAYHAVNGSGPSYIKNMVEAYTPAHPLLHKIPSVCCYFKLVHLSWLVI